MTGTGFPHSEILGSRFVCQLPEAYRRLPRPSSAPGAKASTLCPYKLQPQKTKMLASTVQFSNNDQDHHQHRHPPTSATRRKLDVPDQRPCDQPQAPPPTKSSSSTTEAIRRSSHHTAAVPSGPNSVSCAHPVPTSPVPSPPRQGVLRASRQQAGCSRRSTREHHPPHIRRWRGPWPDRHKTDGQVLLRKEVIQPHLPVRLPCYDLVLIASPTFDHSPPHGLGHGLRVLPTFMT
jgi:hypothetical protein